MTRGDYDLILSRKVSKVDLSVDAHIRPKVITRTNAYRHSVNLAGIFEFACRRRQPVYLFMASHSSEESIINLESLHHLFVSGDQSELNGSGIFAYTDNMPVILTKNLKIYLGMVNGKEGIAKKAYFNPLARMIKFTATTFIVDKPPSCVVVEFDNQKVLHEPLTEDGFIGNQFPIFPINVGIVKKKGESPKCQRTQIPLTPAFAITDYKAQGRTYNKVAIDFETTRNGNKQKDHAGIYVPLSRCKTLEGLVLIKHVRENVFIKQPDCKLITEMQRLRRLEERTVANLNESM